MSKVSRILYGIIGIFFPIIIGLLHMLAHVQDLITPTAKSQLENVELTIFGESQVAWNSWGVMSVMMGMSFIVIGILNLHVVRNLKSDEYPPTLALFAMFVYLLSVIYVGSSFTAIPQFYGGIFGLLLLVATATIKFLRK